LLGASGCGLAEYENELDREQKRLEVIDEENKLLGEPIEAPKSKEANLNVPGGGSTPIFFRPPRGITATLQGNPRADILYQYAPLNRPGAFQRRRGPVDDTPFLNVFVAITPAKDFTQFATQVQQAFAGATASEASQVTREPPGRAPMVFQTRSFTEPAADAKKSASVYRVYFYTGQEYHVALVYHLPQEKAAAADVNKTIEYSLQSLAVGSDAAPKMAQWQRGHPPPKKPG
jgi:hypothetical protein